MAECLKSQIPNLKSQIPIPTIFLFLEQYLLYERYGLPENVVFTESAAHRDGAGNYSLGE
jgi:hypothetical protein